MNVFQCKRCFRIISNDISCVKRDSSYIVVTGVDDCVSMVPTQDPEIYYLKCTCKNKVGECQEKVVDNNRQITFKLNSSSVIRYPIKKLNGNGRSESEESESNSIIANKLLEDNDDKDIKKLAAKVEELEKELMSIKEEKYSEKLETLCAMMCDNIGAVARMAELMCELNPNPHMQNVFQQLF